MPDRGTATSTKRKPTSSRPGRSDTPLNQVQLQGRLAATPERRTLPSGDEVLTFRLVVTRSATSKATRQSRSTVDTIDCTIWFGRLRRTAGTWKAGDILAVEGALRRRFWRSPAGPRSRYDVEVRTATRVAAVPSGGDRRR